MTYAIIGDVHSQGSLLAKALAHCKERELTPILLGDLFDSRCEIDETLYTLNLVKIAQREQGAVVLNSNHQDRMIDLLNGELELADYCSETWRSYDEFMKGEVDFASLKSWLQGLPDGFVFWDKDGVEYCRAHAFFPSQLRRREQRVKLEPYSVFAPDEETRDLMVWGPTKKDGRRFRWWNHTPDNQKFVRVAGHYHTVRSYPKSLVLDANAGFEEGELLLFDVDSKKMVYFGEPDVTIEQERTEEARA